MRIAFAGLLFSLLLTSPAAALPGISLAEAAAEVGAEECPLLIQIKYPWLGCTSDAEGRRSFTMATVAANASWDGDRQIPLGHTFVDGDGAWLRASD